MNLAEMKARLATRRAERLSRSPSRCFCHSCNNVSRASFGMVRWTETFMIGGACRRRLHLTVVK